MKEKNMKKLIISMLTSFVAIFMIATSAHAAMPTLTVVNASQVQCPAGDQNGCWKTSTTARPGDVIAVHLYYGNTGSQPQNAVAAINPSRSGTNVSFSGGINGNSTAHVTLSAPNTIVYMTGSNAACFKPSGSSSCQGVNSSALFGGGANLGTINPGQEFTVIAYFLVEGNDTTPPPPTKYQCNDGRDNDGDGRIDFPNDPGCSGSTDDDESNGTQPTVYECNDGRDNDGDGRIDFPNDPGCSGYTDNDESNGTQNNQCRIDNFEADDVRITEGDSTKIRWNTTGCEYVNITSIGNRLNVDSSATVSPTSDKTYTLTAYPGGNTATVTIRVDEEDRDDECRIDTFKLSRSSIERGQTATLSWKVTGADRVEINGNSKSKNSSMSVSPSSSTTYYINASGNGCSDTESIRLTVNEDTNARPQAITTIATIFGSTSAQLNGIAVPNTSSGSTSAWFEWGPSSSLGYRTSSKNIGSGSGSTPYSDIVNGLASGTTYYYRAAVQNQNGTAYGDIIPFRTQNIVAGTTVVQQPTRVVVQTIRDSVTAESTPSLLELRVESAYDHMCIGGEIEYVVTYRNISSVTLEDAVLRLALPKELTYSGANRGSYDAVDRMTTIDIGRLQPGEQGSVTVRARVNDMAVRNNLTVMTATVVYTNPITRAQEDAIAYSLITVSDECPTVLGASVFGFGSFLPDTLLEWLLLILVILALILIGRNLYKKKEEQKQ